MTYYKLPQDLRDTLHRVLSNAKLENITFSEVFRILSLSVLEKLEKIEDEGVNTSSK
jgi:hypothetical protein